jgi:hypothetical protein
MAVYNFYPSLIFSVKIREDPLPGSAMLNVGVAKVGLGQVFNSKLDRIGSY